MKTACTFAFAVALCLLCSVGFAAEDTSAPRLQIFNGSRQPADIYWLKTAAERVSNGSLTPGQNKVITTGIGHRFVIVGRDDRAEEQVTAVQPVQAFVFLPLVTNGVAATPIPDGQVTAPPPALKIPAFHKKFISAHGFPIVASEKVSDYALKEAAYIANIMLDKRPDVREAMVRSGSRLCIMAYNEYTTDLPEFAFLAKDRLPDFPDVDPREYWDARARGTGGSDADPYCSCGEENLLGYHGDPYDRECILIHEFAHNIHLRGLMNVDPTFDRRLRAAYEAAMKAGLWKGKYAAVNHCEYFAVGVAGWYGHNRFNDHDHNHVHLREQLVEYDPGLAALCREVFADEAPKYAKPATRLTGHLVGYDPAKAPTFIWPERLLKAKKEIRRQAVARNDTANGRELRIVSGWNVHVNRELLAHDEAVTGKALDLLKGMLDEIVRVVPAPAVAELQKVPLYFSPEYPKSKPRAEYHPGAGWLKDNGRDPAMEKGVEFTNILKFEAAIKRMPNFALHELAHSYHDRVLGFDRPDIKAAYQKAKDSRSYDHVERSFGDARTNTFERAYAMTNHKEYFAENTEAFFCRNDFFPFTKEELKQHDPTIFALLEKLWQGPPKD